MKTLDVLLPTAALIIIISMVCLWASPSVQDFMTANSLWNGVRYISGEFGATSIDSLKELPDSPQGKTLLSIPSLQYGEESLAELQEFVALGGRLLLLDDHGQGNGVLEYLGLEARFSGTPLLDPLYCYRNQQLPKITDFSPEIEREGIEVVVLNHATSLTDVAESGVIAWSSAASFLDFDKNNNWSPAEEKGPFPVAAKYRVGRGTVILVSDPSIIINSMIRRDDNRTFVNYLIGLETGQGDLLIDRQHLGKDPRDASRLGLANVRAVLSRPYSLLGLVAIILIAVSRYTLKERSVR
jgi:hypothetical protein